MPIAQRRFYLAIAFAICAVPAIAADDVIGVAADAWTFSGSADLVYAARGDSSDSPLIVDAFTGDSLLSGSDLDLDWAPGVDLRGRLSNSTWGVEGRFLGAFSWDAEASIVTPAFWQLPTESAISGIGVADVAATYSSDFNSAELNAVWRATPTLDVIGGIRWARVSENLDLDADFDTNRAATGYETTSSGFGPQIGIRLHDMQPWEGAPFFVGLEGSIGTIDLDRDVDFALRQEIGPAIMAAGSSSDWSLIGEIAAKAGYAISPNASVQLGYRLLYLDNVASALDQFPATDIVNSTIDPATREMWMHGVTLGVSATF